jgi:hypothetical protein
MVLQSFDLLKVVDNANSIVADIEMFSPLVSCIVPNVTLIQKPSQLDMLVKAANSSKGRSNSSELNLLPPSSSADDGWLFRTGMRFFHGLTNDARFILSAFLDLTEAATANGTDLPTYKKAAGVICKTDFSMNQALATWTSSNGSVQVSNTRPREEERIDLNGYELSRAHYTILHSGYTVQSLTHRNVTICAARDTQPLPPLRGLLTKKGVQTIVYDY